MRVLIQRVTRASVSVAGDLCAEIDAGLLILLGIAEGDDHATITRMCQKLVHLRIFEDAQGKSNLSLLDVAGEALVVSQFTLYADTRKGRRPSFTAAAHPSIAEPLVSRFVQALREQGVSRVESGVFGANMEVSLCNQGPVTLWLDSDQLSRK